MNSNQVPVCNDGNHPRIVKVWDCDFFDRVEASALPKVFHDFLTRVNENLPSPHIALYGLERGHLSLLMSSEMENSLSYLERVPFLALEKQFQQEIIFDQENIFRYFFRLRPPFHLIVLPLRLNNEVKGAMVLLRHESIVPSDQIKESLRACLLGMAALVSCVDTLGRSRLRSSHLAVVNKIIQMLDILVEEEQLYKRIVNSVNKSFKYDHVAIYIVDRSQGVLRLKAMAGKFGKVIPRDQTIPLGQGIVSWVVNHDKTLLSNNVRKNPFFLNWTPDLVTTEAELCVPIHVDKQVIGVLNIEHSESLYFDQDDTNSLELLADRIGVAIKNSRLYSELNRSHDQLQEIVASMGQGLLIVNRDLQIKWVNETVQKWGMNGRPFVDLFGPNSEKVKFDLVQRTLVDGTMRRELIRGSNERYFMVIAAPVLKGDRLRTQVLVVIDDVTAGMQLQDRLERTKQEMETSQRRNILGELAAYIAHEIRNPLNAMTQAADLLETDNIASAPQKKLIGLLKEESKSLNDILSSYIQKAKPPDPKFVVWDLKNIVDQVINLLEADRSITDRINLIVDIQGSIPPVKLDTVSAKQLVLNLLLNSIEAIEEHGEVKIAIRQENNFILLQVSDNGCGIPPSYMQNIFKPFFTTKDKGTGLGLAVVKRITEEHGWEIKVESKELAGSQFTVAIPLWVKEG